MRSSRAPGAVLRPPEPSATRSRSDEPPSSSEKRGDGDDNAVVRVEHRDHPPSVERAARVRDAALHQIADVERDVLLDTDERVLIVEVRHDAAVERSLARARPD